LLRYVATTAVHHGGSPSLPPRLGRSLATAGEARRACLVVGGSGALGQAVVDAFENAGWSAASVDFTENRRASGGVVVLRAEEEFDACAARVVQELRGVAVAAVSERQFSAIVHAGGGWAGSDPGQPDFPSSLEFLWNVNVKSAALAAHAAGELLAPGGILTFTGAAAALDGATPGMCAYGMTKAATHHLMETCGEVLGARGTNPRVHAILPVTIDTPANRAAMPDADTCSWTSPVRIAEEIVGWANATHASPPNGAYVAISTADRHTTFSYM
jgi:dihydropteridine reductase